MATVRITGNWRRPDRMEWVGAPSVDGEGHIERSLPIPEEAYQAIERQISRGGLTGAVLLSTGARAEWFLHGRLSGMNDQWRRGASAERHHAMV